MAARSGPGANLLRASRVFSVPAPLPKPTKLFSSMGDFTSDTATLPHPIYQSIATPPSSLQIGDWGLKRALPLRSTTNTSTPIIKVEAMDTFEHITEFGSAANHTLSLWKWQEMGIPIETPRVSVRPSNFNGTSKSVFEHEIDTTFHERKLAASKVDGRWKFSGPWLAGQTEGEFNEYLEKRVRRQKAQFRNFLVREVLARLKSERDLEIANNKTIAKSRKSIQKDEVNEWANYDLAESNTNGTLKYRLEQEVDAHIKELRQDRAGIFMRIRNFFDLPPVASGRTREDFSLGPDRGDTPIEFPETNSPYAKTGPPKTHPSAGLAYTRSASKIYNHPEFGPQESAPPVEARIVQPSTAGSAYTTATLGVGGFVTLPPSVSEVRDYRLGKNALQAQGKPIPGLVSIDPEKKGGGKMFVQPSYASVDPKGRVILSVGTASAASVAVQQGRTSELRPVQVAEVRSIPKYIGGLRPSGIAVSLNLGRKAAGEENAVEKGEGAKAYGLEFMG
ncbi:hypothetical protein HYFRA_00004734 [Hymenoscyphus fraxineus]|uniref:Uncharacterized protein n=1 Tax=Hymenoscyphus fraxineus TaxID=746836 RepID=A0A9N9KVV0_9HELO|nr:hypothetical protein HYFRA_00004734 [Hymenoscyphus fraxineus]